MIQIEKIEINYFRSIYSEAIKNIRDLSVFSGKNDCGKSNVLRALNLFFNNETGWNEPFDFSKDFSRRRLSECRNKLNSKQFISIKIHFVRGDRYQNSLPDKFWVARTWTRDASIPTQRDSLNKGNIKAKSLDRAQASLQRYLGTITYWYVPAIKDRSYFSYSLGVLKDAILASKESAELGKIVGRFNSTVRNEAESLNEEFRDASGIAIDIHMPESMEQLFRAFSVSTGKENEFPLAVRGDGIQARFLPSLLFHVASKSKRYFIWGFEEPENCIEHGLATMLAKDMQERYADFSQLFLTSHSPAFVSLIGDNISAYRVHRDADTEITPLIDCEESLQSDLGLLELQKEYQKQYLEEMERMRAANLVLKKAHEEATSPILLVEGKTDVMILEEAWRRIHPRTYRPFRIVNCDTSNENDGKGGCGILAKALESLRLDQPQTVGLFDYDKEGIDAFKLNRNFTTSSVSGSIKVAENKHAAAIQFPRIEDLEAYYDARNLQIEFLFPEECLQKKTGGKGLQLVQKQQIVRLEDGSEVGQGSSTAKEHRKITGGKTLFAQKIVPRFSDDDFSAFRDVFDLVEKAFSELTQ